MRLTRGNALSHNNRLSNSTCMLIKGEEIVESIEVEVAVGRQIEEGGSVDQEAVHRTGQTVEE